MQDKTLSSMPLRVKRYQQTGQLHYVTFPFWQKRYYDFNLSSARKLTDRNPVKRGPIENPEEEVEQLSALLNRDRRGCRD
jgi:hypothetical protein